MNSQFKLLALYFLPFILVSTLYLWGGKPVTEVTGNTGGALWVTGFLCAYYIAIILLFGKLRFSPALMIVTLLLALMFLPVRKNISVVDYIKTDSEIFWVERSYISGVLQVFVAEQGIVLKPKKIYQNDEITHEAFLELGSDGVPTLVYSERASDEIYQRHDL